MAVDTATNIKDMDTNLPANSDARAEGAGQIRAVKTAVQNTFPNCGGEVPYTHNQMNTVFASILGGTDGTVATGLLPVGLICDWAGTVNSIPDGWALCNGQTANDIPTPDLSGKFLVAYSSTDTDFNSIGKQGGTKTHNHPHDHGSVTGDTTLTEAQVPSHKHASNVIVRHGDSSGQDLNGVNYDLTYSGTYTNTWEHHKNNPAQAVPDTDSFGGGGSHDHEVFEDDTSATVLPPYYVVAKIMYVGVSQP